MREREKGKKRESERERKEEREKERDSYIRRERNCFLQFNRMMKKRNEKTRREKCGARLSGATVANCVSCIVQI